jgi:hypothetical protein
MVASKGDKLDTCREAWYVAKGSAMAMRTVPSGTDQQRATSACAARVLTNTKHLAIPERAIDASPLAFANRPRGSRSVA